MENPNRENMTIRRGRRKDKSDEEQDDEKGNDQTNGAGDMPGPSMTEAQQTGVKMKGQRGKNQQEGCMKKD
jgi:hypothetical protein